MTRHTISEIKRKKIQILLAEDYPTNQMIAIKHLTGSGFGVTLAKNGQQAVDLFKKRQFDLILMDIQMPLKDGYEATAMIREQEKASKQMLTQHNPKKTTTFNRTPVIAMTAHAIKGYKEKCLAADMDDYIVKPLKKKDLIAMVEKCTIHNKTRLVKPGPKKALLNPSALPDNSHSDDPLNYEKALDEFANDKKFFMEVVNEFIYNVETQLPKIKKAVEEQDFLTLKNQAHSIKGGAANLTAMNLSKIAAALERSGKSADISRSSILLKELEKQFTLLKNFISRLKSHDNSILL